MIFQNGRPIRQKPLQQVVFYLWGGCAASSGVFVLLAAWHYAALSLGDLILPQPLAVLQRAYTMLQQLQVNQIDITLYHATIAVSLAITIGVSLGICAGSSKTLNLLLRPIVTILLGIPPIVWVVLALFWFDMSNISIIFTIAISVMPLMFASSAQGMFTIDNSLDEMLTAYQQPIWNKIRHLYVPHVLNYVLPAAIVAVGSGVKITIMAELLSGSDGIGSKIADARTMLETQEVLAYVVIILLIIMAVEYLLLEPLRIILTPWKQ